MDEDLDYDEYDMPPHQSRMIDDDDDDDFTGLAPTKPNLEEDIDREEKLATEKAFGITDSADRHLRVSQNECLALRKELGAGDRGYEFRAVLVHGVEAMKIFDIQKIFADFRVTRCWKNKNEAIVQFSFRQDAAAMMLNMSKMLKRVRGKKVADEDGEVVSDDDDVEDGQIMQEKGDDVELIEGLKPDAKGIINSEKKGDFVIVDVSARSVPDGKWRVLIKHVAADKFILVRYPTRDEYDNIRTATDMDDDEPVSMKRMHSEGFWTHESANRAGLNLFDKEGKELEWDFEHDTRFYEEKKDSSIVDTPEKEKFELPKGIKVRGRGAVKCGFLFSEAAKSSLASDDQKQIKRKKDEDANEYQKDDVVGRMGGNAAEPLRPGQTSRSIRDRIQYRH